MARPGGDHWRWNIGRHLKPTTATIVVSEPSDEAKAEREKKIKDGAEVIPFGFARAIPRETPPEPPEVEPVTWDGDYA